MLPPSTYNLQVILEKLLFLYISYGVSFPDSIDTKKRKPFFVVSRIYTKVTITIQPA